jgi:hypothetical protein
MTPCHLSSLAESLPSRNREGAIGSDYAASHTGVIH